MPLNHSYDLKTPGYIGLSPAGVGNLRARQATFRASGFADLSVTHLAAPLPPFGQLLCLRLGPHPPAASICPPPAGARPPVCSILPPLKLRHDIKDGPAGSCAPASFVGLPAQHGRAHGGGGATAIQ